MPLEQQILSAFRAAMREGRLTAAEHLLQALEALSDECEDVLNEAYLVVADHAAGQPVSVVGTELPALPIESR